MSTKIIEKLLVVGYMYKFGINVTHIHTYGIVKQLIQNEHKYARSCTRPPWPHSSAITKKYQKYADGFQNAQMAMVVNSA